MEGEKIVAVTDNLSIPRTEEVEQWLKDHPRWSFQFAPKHASWLNQIEIFCSILWRRLLKHGVLHQRDRPRAANARVIETYNRTAEPPFKWTYTGKAVEA